MTIAQDMSSILDDWDDTLTIRRGAVTHGATGAPTVTWATNGTASGKILPVGAETAQLEIGLKKKSTHDIFFTNGTDVLENDRIRPSTWSAGDDEYQIRGVRSHSPSHVKVGAILVKGHGG